MTSKTSKSGQYPRIRLQCSAQHTHTHTRSDKGSEDPPRHERGTARSRESASQRKCSRILRFQTHHAPSRSCPPSVTSEVVDQWARDSGPTTSTENKNLLVAVTVHLVNARHINEAGVRAAATPCRQNARSQSMNQLNKLLSSILNHLE